MFISKRKHEPAHYMLNIESFSLLSEAKPFKIESDVFDAVGHKWRLDLYPKGKDEESNEGSHISLYVVICDTERGWEICVDVCLFVYDHLHNCYVTFQDGNGHRTRFHEKKMTWGFDKLVSLESFMKTETGYLCNDSCVFGVEVFAVPNYTQLDRCLSMSKPSLTMNSHTWTIDNFSAITKNSLVSEVFRVGKINWRLALCPKGHGTFKGSHLSIYFGVNVSASLPSGWKVYAKFKLRVKSQDPKRDVEKEDDHWFQDSSCYGFPSFMQLSQLNDSENEFLLNDTLTAEVNFSVIGTLKYFI